MNISSVSGLYARENAPVKKQEPRISPNAVRKHKGDSVEISASGNALALASVQKKVKSGYYSSEAVIDDISSHTPLYYFPRAWVDHSTRLFITDLLNRGNSICFNLFNGSP